MDLLETIKSAPDTVQVSIDGETFPVTELRPLLAKPDIWLPRCDVTNGGRVRTIKVSGKFRRDHDDQILHDKITAAIAGVSFYEFSGGGPILAMPGTDRYYHWWLVGICHPDFAELPDGGALIPYHDQQILDDGTIAPQTEHLV